MEISELIKKISLHTESLDRPEYDFPNDEWFLGDNVQAISIENLEKILEEYFEKKITIPTKK